MKRTSIFDVDGDFEYVCDVTKTGELPDGRRFVRGVASGVAEDQDGERVSTNALAKMARTPLAGGAVKVTASHDQDWLTEFGDVTKVEHDAGNDELLVECALPPEGEDPIADKAWRELHNGRKLGFSIGGKLKKAYYELADRGGRVVKRKVLDEILLRHVALTAKPSYRGTFAEAVAKTFTGDIPADDDFADHDDDEVVDELVGKAAPPAAEEDVPAGDATGAGAGDTTQGPPAGTGDTAEPSDAEQAKDLPMARHLCCPNCGEEFAAPMPDEGAKTPSNDDTDTDEGDAHKSLTEDPTMDTIDETVEKLRALADTEAAEDVTKTETAAEETATVTDDEVAKTETADEGDVLKIVAASHRHLAEQVDGLTGQTNDALTAVAKSLAALHERFDALPVGRKSAARVLPALGEVEKTETETDDVAKAIENPDATALDVLKAQNAARGIR